MGLDRLYGAKEAVFTPSQNNTLPTANTGTGGYQGRVHGQLGYTGGYGGSTGVPAQTQFTGMNQQMYNDLAAQQKNNAAAYGYDANGNWSLLNGTPDFMDVNTRNTPYTSLIDTYGLRPTGYEGANSGRINTTGDSGLPYSATNPGGYQPTEVRTGTTPTTGTPPTSAAPSGGAPRPGDPNPVPGTGTPVENEAERRKRLGLGGLGVKRGDAQAYGGAAQYNPYFSQNQGAGSYGGLGYSSAQGNQWGGGGRSWNKAIWS